MGNLFTKGALMTNNGLLIKDNILNIPHHFINQIPGYFSVVTTDSKYISANLNTIRKLCGHLDMDTLFGATYGDISGLVAEQHDNFVVQDQETLQRNASIKIIARCCFVKDNWITVFGEKFLIRDEEDNIAGVACHLYDITSSNIIDIYRVMSLMKNQTSPKKLAQQFSYMLEQGYPDVQLSNRETEILFFLLRGKSNKQIAALLHLSPRTIESYVERIKDHLICKSKAEVIEKGIFLGYMNILPQSLFEKIESFPSSIAEQ